MRITLENMKKVINGLREDLGEGFVFTDIWSTSTDKSVAFHHQHQYGAKPKHLKVFGEITRILDKTLHESDYPALGDFYLINLADNHVAVVLNYSPSRPGKSSLTPKRTSASYPDADGYQQFVLVDLSKTTMGVLMSIALPNMLGNLE